MTFEIRADTKPFAEALGELEKLADGFGRQMTGALKSAVVSGKSFEDVLRNIGMNLASMALSQALQPLAALGSSLFSGVVGGILPFAKGGVVPFADGGVVSSPTYFPMAGGTGLMGEAGAEAILPLQRGADGRL
uniref:phage tail tape measure protein n=2 Tax=Nitratireductor TaxID=245876 RepID=UPI0005608C33